ncbi:hypothetical protein VEE34_43090 (plasmid) [Escherichia coli]|nr:hypothetical protein VEE34_43090 [Escherichia coli]
MLEKDYQLSAYKKLAAAGGMKTPGAITSARNSANTAKLLAEELTGLILDTIVYPDTITSYVSTIRTTTTGLTNIVELATKHADLLAGYADLSMLLQLDIGWDVYCHANEREVSELPISIAIGDVTITKSLEDAVNALNTSSLVAAMGEINQTLNTGSGSSSGSGSGGGTATLNRPGFPGECFICELRLPDHCFRWKHNKLFLLLPEEYGPAFPAIVDCYTSPPT